MAEDPKLAVLNRDYPVLRRLVATCGEDYSKEDLRRLERFLGHYLALPAIESGFEAFICFESCDVLHYYADWRLLQVDVLPSFHEVYANQSCPVVEVVNLDGVEIHSDTALDVEKLSVLSELGKRLDQTQPRVFLLWENCD